MREEEKKHSLRKIKLKRFFEKRWVYPAIYITAGAILLSAFFWFQARGQDGAHESEFEFETNQNNQLAEEDALEVNQQVEEFKWPVANQDEVEVVTYFYDPAADEEEQEAAIINDGNSYYPSTGIAIASKDGESFEVQAAMSGTVTSVAEDALLGNVVTIEHAEGIETVYQALENVEVKEGDRVKQGEVIGKAGKSLLNEEAGVHTHFEIRKNGFAVNPLEYFKKSLTVLQEADIPESELEEEADEKEEAKEEKSDNAGSDEEKKDPEAEKENNDN